MIHPGVSKSICLKRKVFTVHLCVLITLQCMLSSMGCVRTHQTPGELLQPPVQLSDPWDPLDLPKDKWLTTSSSIMHNNSVISAKLEVVSQFKAKPAGWPRAHSLPMWYKDLYQTHSQSFLLIRKRRRWTCEMRQWNGHQPHSRAEREMH